MRHHGALGPRAPLRAAVTLAARDKANFQSLLDGLATTGAAGMAVRAKRAASVAAERILRGWAACLGRILGVDDIKCPKCGGELRAVAAIQDDVELVRLMEHLGLEEDFPRTTPARSPPGMGGEDSQVDPAVEAWEGKDEG